MLKYLPPIFVLAISASTASAAWVVEPVDLKGDSGWVIDLDVDSSGQPAAAYFTTSPLDDRRYSVRSNEGWQVADEIRYGRSFGFDNDGVAHFVTTTDLGYNPTLTADGRVYDAPIESVDVTQATLLGFDSHNYPHLAYVDYDRRTLRYAKWDGSDWHSEDVATSDSFSIANRGFLGSLDRFDKPHFVFPAGGTGPYQPMHYAHRERDGWSISRATDSLAYAASMDIDSQGRPHLFYDRSDGSGYARFDGSDWVETTFSSQYGKVSMALDQTDLPHIFTAGINRVGHLQLKYGTNWSWEPIEFWSSSTTGAQQVDAVIADGVFHVVFATSKKQIYYATAATEEADPVDGDYNNNGIVDAADYTVWRDNLGAPAGTLVNDPVGGVIGASQYQAWRAKYGSRRGLPNTTAILGVPEPTTLSGILLALMFAPLLRRSS
jgi:hypothetical protein